MERKESNEATTMPQQITPEVEVFARIKVLGIGGSGKNAVNHMINSKVKGVEFIAVNTDAHAFKGRVGMLGMVELHPVVSSLESALRAAEPAGELLDRVEDIVRQTSGNIKAVLETKPS
jgi:hypothetical protein